jgi:hypothetical protein
MLIALTQVQDPFPVWLLPHLLAALAGASFIVLRQSKYRVSVRGMLVLVTLFALALAVSGHACRWYVTHWELVATVRFWKRFLVSIPLTIVFSSLFCRLYYFLR